jgi:hypothetical protein
MASSYLLRHARGGFCGRQWNNARPPNRYGERSFSIVLRRAMACCLGAFPHGLFPPGAKGISKELRRPTLELFPETSRPIPDGTAALIAENLFNAPAFGGVFFVFDAVNPLVATNAIEGRFSFRSQCFHRELNLRSPRSSRFGSPSLRPKRNN